jgi:iron(III) transport system substrate-binding protein
LLGGASPPAQDRAAGALLGGGSPSAQASPQALEAGWQLGLSRIIRMVANSRALTDSASKPTRDTVRGDCMASMAIDFQAKAEAAWSARESGGAPRLAFVTPVGGTSVSPDPIGLLRGAPQAALMKDFITFVLSPAGQRLWSYRLGEPGGPVRYELHRLPIRRDVLTAEDRRHMSHPDDDPFAIAAAFTYRPQWTGHLYGLIGPVVKSTAMDVRDELTAAWRAIIATGGPAACPEAMALLETPPFRYAEAKAVAAQLKEGPTVAVPLLRRWSENAQARYLKAARLAQSARPQTDQRAP